MITAHDFLEFAFAFGIIFLLAVIADKLDEILKYLRKKIS
jgi:hypothetical protein